MKAIYRKTLHSPMPDDQPPVRAEPLAEEAPGEPIDTEVAEQPNQPQES